MEIQDYNKKKADIQKAISSLETQIKSKNPEKQEKASELRELEKQTTSIQPTIDDINSLLNQFGFKAFSLIKTPSGNTYRLVRPDGAEAKTTLSEGEKSFVCFLYFYHLLKGSMSESGMTDDRIVVFDDPVSSLDSDILFIVSSLIRKLIEETRGGKTTIKQIFIMTHNVYFHKEITFNKNRHSGDKLSDETFWMIQKNDNGPKIQNYDKNPISTSYDLLWSEVRNRQQSSQTIQNALRRILENYFKILGHIDFDLICDKFEGTDKLICKSLFSWVNDGSHSSLDDVYISIENTQIDNYLRVFRRIFDKMGHMGHYKMMMGDAYVEEPSTNNNEEANNAL
jgi:wobble nucleotide-excising tRNase